MAYQSNIFIDTKNFFDFTAQGTQKILLRLHERPLQILIDMEEPPSFTSERPFHGEKQHFPYGLERSGEFSVRQSELLQNHGWAYLELAEGVRKPTTSEEARFIKVFAGKLAARSNHEKAWEAYLNKTSMSRNVRSPDKVRSLQDLSIDTDY